MNLYLRELKANRKSLIIWSIAMIVLIILSVQKFEAFMIDDNSKQEFIKLIEAIPSSLSAAFGISKVDVTTPIGYMIILYVYLAVMGAIHAGMIGSGIIVKEERDKTVEFLMTKPISKNKIILYKILAALTNVIIFNIVTLLSILIFMNNSLTSNMMNDIYMLIIGMLFLQILFMFIGTAIGMISKKHKKATIYIMSFVLITYFTAVIIDIYGKADYLSFLTPFKYFDAKIFIEKGFNIYWILFSILIIILSILFGIRKYKKRDFQI